MVVSNENAMEVHCSLIGDGMVGKTCLIKSFVDRTFPPNYVATVLDKYSVKTSVNNCKYNITVTDIAGEHDLEENILAATDLGKTNVFVICYSVVDRESFESVKTYWAQEIKYMVKNHPVILVATQIDMRRTGNAQHVSLREGQALAKGIGASDFVECSALAKIGVNTVFKAMLHTALRYRKKRSSFKRLFNK